MGFLKLFSRSEELDLLRLPSGSFTLDREGQLITSTLPRSFPEALVREIGREVLNCFRSARQARLPLAEIIIRYAALKVLARELRGGAIIFLMPQLLHQPLRRRLN